MACRATHTFIHVNAVIEVGKVRQIVNANPLNRLTGAKTIANGFEIRTIGPDLFVAVHARRGRRQSRGRGRFDGSVTVAAIDAVITDVMFMTELNGLLTFDPLAGVPGRTVQLDSDPKQSDDYEYSAINRDFRQRVRAVMEDLWHQPTNFSAQQILLRITPYFIKWKKIFKLGHRLDGFKEPI